MSRTYPNAPLSVRRAKMALAALLHGCTSERLAGFTAEGLHRAYNVPLGEVERMLAAARWGRGV